MFYILHIPNNLNINDFKTALKDPSVFLSAFMRTLDELFPTILIFLTTGLKMIQGSWLPAVPIFTKYKYMKLSCILKATIYEVSDKGVWDILDICIGSSGHIFVF